jgi:hypothetical protein
MKKSLLVVACAFCLAGAMALSGFLSVAEQNVRHVVVFKYKPGITEHKLQQVTDALAALKNKIPGTLSFEHGINDSPENKNRGFTHVYMFTFENAKARDNYLVHPEHKKFLQLLGELNVLEDLFVVDFAPKVKL